MILCPNLNNPQVKKEFDELVSVLGENTAYYVWDQNNGYSLDYAPNGAQSKLFQDLYDYYKDRSKAIEAKAKTLSKEFKQWFQGSKVVDNNGEPLIVYHGTRTSQSIKEEGFSKKMSGKGNRGANNQQFYFTNNYQNAEYTGVKSNEIEPLIDIITSVYDLFDTTEIPSVKDIYETIDLNKQKLQEVKSSLWKVKDDSIIKRIINKLFKLFGVNTKSSDELREEYKKNIYSINNDIEELYRKAKIVDYFNTGIDFLKGDRTKSSINTLRFIKESINPNSPYRQYAANRLINTLYNTNDLIYSPEVFPVFLNIKAPLVSDFKMKPSDTNPLLQGKFSSLLQDYNNKEQQLLEELSNSIYDGAISKNKFDILFGDIYIAKEPNQIKSIDNNGQFSLTDNNIYNYIKDNISTKQTNSYYAGKQGIGKMFNTRQQSAKSVLNNILNNNILTEEQYQLAQSLFDNLDDNVQVELVNNKDYVMSYQNGVIRVNIDSFNSLSNYDITNAYMHELLHHFTVNQYKNNASFKSKIDNLFNKVSEQFPKSKYKRKGLYYGLTSPQEFISELYVNKAFRDAVIKKNMSWWRRILFSLLNALKLTKMANKLQPNDVYSVYNAIQDAVNNRKLDPDLEDTGEELFYQTDVDYSWLKGEADNIIKKAMNGLKASEKALKSRDKSPVQITKLQQDIARYTLQLQKGEDQEVLAEFITRASQQFRPVLNIIRKAVSNPNILTNDDLKNFKNDFLDFYGPITEEINRKLFFQGYFNNLSPEQIENIKNNLSLINKAYQEIQGKYNFLLKQRVINIFKEKGQQYGFKTDEVEQFINDKLNNSAEDMNVIWRYLQFASNASDMGIRMVNRMMTDINSQVQWFTNNKTQDLIRSFSNITKSQQLLYFEKDKDGKATGYLIRPLNYGQFKKDYHEFLSDLDSRYGVVDQNYYLLEGDNFINYCKEKEEWLEKHCERKFKNTYYQEYNKLSQLAREKSKIYSEQISAIIESVTDQDGPHLEQLSDSEWARLDKLYSMKKNLSNDYDLDGNLKQGEDLQIAKEFQRFYDSIGQGNIKSKTMTQKEVLKLMEQKQKELSPELYEKWFRRNISLQFPEDFIKAIKGLSTVDFGSDQALYDQLYEERRQLLQLGRDNNNPINIAEKYTQQAKERILELDKQINELRSKHSKADKEFFKIASIIPTTSYERDKAQAKAKGKEAYQKWYNANHYRDAKGNERIASYYTRLIINKDSGFKYEYRLSRMNQELDKNSNMINPNYNFEDPEYYQPKKELYDNSKAYEKAIKTKAQQDIYKLIVDTMDEANSKLSFMSKRDNYRLPQATGDFIDFTMRQGNFFKNLSFMIRDSIVARNDDTQFALDNSITKADGTQLNLVPTHYVKMLEHPENISRNLIGLLSEYSRMAENYRLKNEQASQFDIIQDLYDIRTFTKQNINNFIQSNIEGKQSNTSNRLRDYIEMQLYGRTTKPWTWEFKRNGKVYSISVTKLASLIQRYASASNLGNNFLSIGKSILQGFDKFFVEGFAGQFYTMSDLSKSFLRQLWRTPKRLLNIGNAMENDISYALLEHNGIAHDTREKVEGLQYNRLFRIFYKYLVWGGWQAADFMVKVPIVESVYANTKYIPEQGKFMTFTQYEKLFPNETIKQKRKRFNHLNTISMLDVYQVKNGKLVIKSEYEQYSEAINDKAIQQSLKNISSILCSRIDGQLQTEDKLSIFQNAIGAAIGMHRSFFIVNMNENLFKNYQYNPLIEDYDEAKYVSGFVGIGKWLYNLYNSVKHLGNKESIQQNKKSYTNPEYYNMKRILMQLSIVGMLYLLVAFWLKPEAERDKDNQLKQITGYTLDALRFEEFSEYNPLDLVNQIKNVSPAITPFENALNLVNPFKFDKNYSTDVIKSGYYKDMEKWQRTLIKSVPGLRGAWESQGARIKWQYLESQLDK